MSDPDNDECEYLAVYGETFEENIILSNIDPNSDVPLLRFKGLEPQDDWFSSSSWFGNMTTWKTPLPVFEDGNCAFNGSLITTWNVELPSLKEGVQMFANSHLKSFTIDLPNLVNGYWMFNSCSDLSTFNSNAPRLVDG